MMKRWSFSKPTKPQRLWIDNRKGYQLKPILHTVAADPLVRQYPEGRIVPANLWFRNAPDGEMLREVKHTSDTFERGAVAADRSKVLPVLGKQWGRG